MNKKEAKYTQYLMKIAWKPPKQAQSIYGVTQILHFVQNTGDQEGVTNKYPNRTIPEALS